MKIDFEKSENGLVPAVVQDADTGRVLTVGFMNKKALRKTRKNGVVTFYSRTEGVVRIFGHKGGSSLKVKEIRTDCDGNAVLVKAYPKGKVCEVKSGTCFSEKNKPDQSLLDLERIIHKRKSKPAKSSHTTKMFSKGANQIAKKFGEESVELVIEALNGNDDLFRGEAGDVLYYFLVMLADREIRIDEVVEVLRKRRRRRI